MGGCRVRFEPYGLETVVPCGTTVLEAARRAGLQIASSCGGRGTCGDCAVRVLVGEPAVVRPAVGRAARVPQGVTLACLAEVADGMVVRPVRPASAKNA